MHIQDPTSQRLTWNKFPKSVLVIQKIRDASLLQPFKEVCICLTVESNMIVYVEKEVLEDPAIGIVPPIMANFENFQSQVNQVIEGNAVVILRSRLEVRVVEEPRAIHNGLNVYLDGHLITTVQGDGMIASTPKGNTAYAAAAGPSMVHPNVPAIMATPICPHSLSFRPIVVPAGVDLKIILSPEHCMGVV
ncbi:hypothetical protein U0070_024714 [Myodes glareolus]|uniref:NAD(+) kinase n=1 Tax=Myodes glareolus TaxID=447135 RepID=A0AAW0HVW5_MYOGA